MLWGFSFVVFPHDFPMMEKTGYILAVWSFILWGERIFI